ncbi:hypothetical protein ACFC1R_37120 [Kitasatospora sp. NPDC056138]
MDDEALMRGRVHGTDYDDRAPAHTGGTKHHRRCVRISVRDGSAPCPAY